jgi:hypothetical protein
VCVSCATAWDEVDAGSNHFACQRPCNVTHVSVAIPDSWTFPNKALLERSWYVTMLLLHALAKCRDVRA